MSEGTIELLLAQRIGLDPSTVGRGLLTRALHARMAALGLSRSEDYLRLLRASGDEQDELIEEVVIPESWFFRDERPFDLLRRHVEARGLNPPAPRVLSIPCAAGEEPYSIAIVLRELGLPPERGTIDAVDVSARSLERARRGVYGEGAFRGFDPALRARYFHPRPDGFELDPSVRTQVRFLRGNLVDPDLLRGEPAYDVIFCRNVLIYLDPAARQAVADNLDRWLGPSGLLFLGHADRLEAGENRFEPAGEGGCFAHRRAAPSGSPSVIHPLPRERVAAPRPGEKARSTRRARPGARSPGPSDHPLPRERVGTIGLGRGRGGAPSPGPSDHPLPRERVNHPQPASLDEAAALADRGKNDEAAALCELFLRESGPSARAFFLLGLIRKAQGDEAQAEACWQKTVYLDPQHDEALLALALCADRRGDPAAAAGHRRRADRARLKKGAP